MNYFENEYALPIVLCSCDDAMHTAKTIKNKMKFEVHFFSDKLSFINRFRYRFHKLPSRRDEILFLSLCDFTQGIHEYYTPVLIYCSKHNSEFIRKYREHLELLYIILSTDEIEKIFEGN